MLRLGQRLGSEIDGPEQGHEHRPVELHDVLPRELRPLDELGGGDLLAASLLGPATRS